MFFIR